MHRESDNPELETAAVRLYLDESGGSDPNTPHAVVGGMLITRQKFLRFEDAWNQMLDDHKIIPPLHMKDFGRPHGRFAKMSDCCRHELFLEVQELISSHRVGSISVSLSNADYRKFCPPEVVKVFSVYGMCFVLTAWGTQLIVQHNSYHQKIPIILDSGNPYAEHVRSSHANMQKLAFPNIGSLTFADDKDFGILQAADVIAWAARRRASNISFGYGFCPLEIIFADPDRHKEAPWMEKWLKDLGDFLRQSIDEEKRKSDI
jgi:hypothetical protein